MELQPAWGVGGGEAGCAALSRTAEAGVIIQERHSGTASNSTAASRASFALHVSLLRLHVLTRAFADANCSISLTAPDVCWVGGDVMVLAIDFRRQARVCARLAEECEDQHLAERLRLMAADLAAKADDIEELPTERLRRTMSLLAA